MFLLAVTLKTMFFEYPWPLVAAVWVTALFLFFLARSRADKRLFRSAVTAFSLGLVIIILSLTVTTENETVKARTKAFVATTAPLDIKQFNTFIEPFAAVVGPNGDTWITYDQLQTILPNLHKYFYFDSQYTTVPHTESMRTGNIATTVIVRTKIGEGYTFKSEWTLLWKKDPAGNWKVVEIRFDKLQNKPPTKGVWNV
ncbi:hypothetical protein [Poriferisphaera sp. WC338]|uniref:hypothetical protein n=1 Tax=Poriferisphaera sp. WC338 TaxID=3425129 RepID=UPI003D815084